MRQTFTLQRAYVLASDAPALLSDIVGRTQSTQAAESILRSLDRLGSDDSIRHYEITSAPVQRSHRDAAPVVWTVRAVRG